MNNNLSIYNLSIYFPLQFMHQFFAFFFSQTSPRSHRYRLSSIPLFSFYLICTYHPFKPSTPLQLLLSRSPRTSTLINLTALVNLSLKSLAAAFGPVSFFPSWNIPLLHFQDSIFFWLLPTWQRCWLLFISQISDSNGRCVWVYLFV